MRIELSTGTKKKSSYLHFRHLSSDCHDLENLQKQIVPVLFINILQDINNI